MRDKLSTNLRFICSLMCVSLELVAFSDHGWFQNCLSSFRFATPRGDFAQGNTHARNSKKGWRSTGRPAVCVAWWKLQGQGGTVIIWQSSKRSNGRKWTKMWQGSTLAGMMLLWAGKGFPLTVTLLQPPCVMNHDASTVSMGIKNNTPSSLQSEK